MIDFIIVAFSLVSVFSLGGDLKFIKVFRMIRVLRPLRVISRNEGLKIAVQSLLNAIPDVFNVLVISGLFFTLFGIFGTNYFKGRFSYCLLDNVGAQLQESLKTKWECLNSGGEWLNHDSTFDNVFRSILSLFIMSTTEGWVGMMWNGVDATGIDLQPARDHSIYWVFFFILFIMFGSQFIMNLFVGVVINTLGNVWTLLVDRYHHRAGIRTNAHFIVGVSHVPDHIADDLLVVHNGLRRDFPGNDCDARRHHRLTSNTALRVLSQQRVQDSVGNLIGKLVRMPHADGFTGKQKTT